MKKPAANVCPSAQRKQRRIPALRVELPLLFFWCARDRLGDGLSHVVAKPFRLPASVVSEEAGKMTDRECDVQILLASLEVISPSPPTQSIACAFSLLPLLFLDWSYV